MHSDHGCEHSDEHAVTVLHWLRGKDGLSVKAAGDIVKRCRQTVKDWTTTSSNGGLCKPGVVEELHVVAASERVFPSDAFEAIVDFCIPRQAREQDYRWLSYAQAVPHAEVSAWKPPGIEANTDPYNDDTWYSDWDSILDFHAVRSEDVDIPHTSPSKPPARVKAPLLRTYGRRGGSRIRASPAPSEMELFSQTMSSSPRRDIPSALAAFRSLLTAPPKQADELVERINSTSASSDDESENDHLSTHPRRPAAKRMRKSARKAGGSVKSPIPERTKSTRTTSRPKLVFQELQPTPEMLQHLITGQSRDAQGHVPLFKLRGLAFPEGAGGDEAQAQAAVISKIASAIASSTTVTATTSMMTRGGRLRSRLPTAHILNANLDPPSGTQIVNLFSKKPGIPDPRPHARTLTSDDTDHILSNITDAIEDFTADNIPNVLQRPNTNEDVIAATSSRSRAGDLVDDSFGNMDVDHMSAANEPSFSNNDIDGVADDDRQAMCQPSLDESEMLPPDLTASRSVFENDSVSMPEIPTTETSDARKPHAPLSFPAASSKQAVSPRRRQAMRIAPNSNTGPRTHGTALESNMKSVTSSIIPDIVFTSPMHDAVTVYTAGQVATSSTSPSRASRVKVSKVSRNSKDLPDIDLADFIELAWRKVRYVHSLSTTTSERRNLSEGYSAYFASNHSVSLVT